MLAVAAVRLTFGTILVIVWAKLDQFLLKISVKLVIFEQAQILGKTIVFLTSEKTL